MYAFLHEEFDFFDDIDAESNECLEIVIQHVLSLELDGAKMQEPGKSVPVLPKPSGQDGDDDEGGGEAEADVVLVPTAKRRRPVTLRTLRLLCSRLLSPLRLMLSSLLLSPRSCLLSCTTPPTVLLSAVPARLKQHFRRMFRDYTDVRSISYI
jgi:hypothetical protein